MKIITDRVVNESGIDPLDSGFTYGVLVFETFRISRGQVFLQNEHLGRLNRSLKAIGIKEVSAEKFQEDISKLSLEFGDSDIYVRYNVTGGKVDLRLSGNKLDQPNTIIQAKEIDPYESQEKVAKILDSTIRHKPEYFDETGFRIKSNDYLSGILAQKELEEYSQSLSDDVSVKHLEGILLTPDGFVAEALTSNVFWVKDGQIYTSPLSLGILPGIIRQYICDNFEVQEKVIKAAELLEADEIFLTNSINFVCALSNISDHRIPGLSGEIFNKVNSRFV